MHSAYIAYQQVQDVVKSYQNWISFCFACCDKIQIGLIKATLPPVI